ncbi:MAG TPA: hypothetical protein VN797_02730 [Gemmatimonadaceae bacterium]|jgi:hypothetical protein|nr:hypothetical protein [Gemmatimonadaceae bacterium]
MNGWKILCPDGAERHYPYNSLGDAEFDARTYSSTMMAKGCACDDKMLLSRGKCPGGEHTVVPCVFTPPQRVGSA